MKSQASRRFRHIARRGRPARSTRCRTTGARRRACGQARRRKHAGGQSRTQGSAPVESLDFAGPHRKGWRPSHRGGARDIDPAGPRDPWARRLALDPGGDLAQRGLRPSGLRRAVDIRVLRGTAAASCVGDGHRLVPASKAGTCTIRCVTSLDTPRRSTPSPGDATRPAPARDVPRTDPSRSSSNLRRNAGR
jgi:hypothetical protein